MSPSQPQSQKGLGPPQLQLRSVHPPLQLALCSPVDPGSHFRQLLGEENNSRSLGAPRAGCNSQPREACPRFFYSGEHSQRARGAARREHKAFSPACFPRSAALALVSQGPIPQGPRFPLLTHPKLVTTKLSQLLTAATRGADALGARVPRWWYFPPLRHTGSLQKQSGTQTRQEERSVHPTCSPKTCVAKIS